MLQNATPACCSPCRPFNHSRLPHSAPCPCRRAADVEKRQLGVVIEGLKRDVAALKRDVAGRDEAIAEKEKRILDLKHKTQVCACWAAAGTEPVCASAPHLHLLPSCPAACFLHAPRQPPRFSLSGAPLPAGAREIQVCAGVQHRRAARAAGPQGGGAGGREGEAGGEGRERGQCWQAGSAFEQLGMCPVQHWLRLYGGPSARRGSFGGSRRTLHFHGGNAVFSVIIATKIPSDCAGGGGAGGSRGTRRHRGRP